MVIKSSIKLEKDAMKPNIYYINFKYISLLNFDMTILLNPIHHKQNEIQPNENFKLIKITNIKLYNVHLILVQKIILIQKNSQILRIMT